MHRRAILIVTAILISLSALFGVFPQTVSAAAPTPYLAPGVLSDAKTMGEAESLAICMEYNNGYAIDGWNGSKSELTPDKVASGKWFRDSSTQYRMWNSYYSGGLNCNKLDVNQALNDIGWTSKVQAVCDLGMGRENKSNCVSGSGNFQWNGGNKQDVINHIFKVYKGGYFDANKDYVRALDLLQQQKVCNIHLLDAVSTATPDEKAKANDAVINIVGSDGVSVPTYYTLGAGAHSAWGYKSLSDENYVDDVDCGFLVNKVNSNSASYAKWVGQNQPGSANNAGTCDQYATLLVNGPAGKTNPATKDTYQKALKACTDGQTNKSDPAYCTANYPPAKHVPGLPATDQPQSVEYNACLYGQQKATTSPNDGSGGPTNDSTKPSCSVEGIGWLVCPVMNFMARINDEAYGFLASYFLSVDTSLLGAQTQSAWSAFRDIANVAFVIAILFIVYSQVTSIGLNNYGIKRMLPRLIFAALLVNVSFWVCALAVDVSNLLGYAIPQFFTSINIGGAVHDTGALTAVGQGLSWVLIIGGVLAAAVGVALAISVPVVLAALLAIGLVVLMLVGRQAFIVLLIVISPLAFVAYLLPNTEQWFKKWYKAFFALLMLFPVVGTVFGASNMAANIINNAGGGSDHIITQIVALAVSAVPFFVVPSLLKGSLAATGALGAKLQGMANGAGKKVGARVKDSSRLGSGLSDMKKYRDQQRAIKYAKGRGTGVMAGVGRIKGGKGYNEKARLRAESLENEEYESDVKAATENQSRHMSFEQKRDIATGATAASITERDAAIRFMMQSGNFAQRQEVLASMGSMTMGQKHSAVGGARAKGDGTVYGNSNLGALEDAEEGALKDTDVQQALNEGAINRINSGEISPETFTRDTYTSSYIAGQAQHATDQAKNNLAQSLSDYAATDQGKKATFATQGDVQRVIQGAPTTPAAPQSAPPSTTTSSSPQWQPAQPPTQGANQLSIPHNNSPAPQPTPPAAPAPPPHQPPGTQGYTQGPSGLWAPPSAHTPPSSPPNGPPTP